MSGRSDSGPAPGRVDRDRPPRPDPSGPAPAGSIGTGLRHYISTAVVCLQQFVSCHGRDHIITSLVFILVLISLIMDAQDADGAGFDCDQCGKYCPSLKSIRRHLLGTHKLAYSSRRGHSVPYPPAELPQALAALHADRRNPQHRRRTRLAAAATVTAVGESSSGRVSSVKAQVASPPASRRRRDGSARPAASSSSRHTSSSGSRRDRDGFDRPAASSPDHRPPRHSSRDGSTRHDATSTSSTSRHQVRSPIRDRAAQRSRSRAPSRARRSAGPSATSPPSPLLDLSDGAVVDAFLDDCVGPTLLFNSAPPAFSASADAPSSSASGHGPAAAAHSEQAASSSSGPGPSSAAHPAQQASSSSEPGPSTAASSSGPSPTASADPAHSASPSSPGSGAVATPPLSASDVPEDVVTPPPLLICPFSYTEIAAVVDSRPDLSAEAIITRFLSRRVLSDNGIAILDAAVRAAVATHRHMATELIAIASWALNAAGPDDAQREVVERLSRAFYRPQ